MKFGNDTIHNLVTKDLLNLRTRFNESGFDIRLVGGCVRDLISGVEPKDIDLCTDANPTEQIEIYQKHNYRFEPTGFDHGTITVIINHVPYEITSLRLDVATDGRRATVAYTRDWIADLERRDLTFNAMSMTFDGELIDPFGGREDLENGTVKFVGDPTQRIKEDYLRILRWFRFAGRYRSEISNNFNGHNAAVRAIEENKQGLSQISRERVWSEIKAILKHSSGPDILGYMCIMHVNMHIDLPRNKTVWGRVRNCKHAQSVTSDPEILMAAWCLWDINEVDKLAKDWKWSKAEQTHAEWLCNNIAQHRDLRKLIAVENVHREWVAELAAIEERDAWEQQALVHWVFKPFPVDGNDLIAQGVKPGPQIGRILKKLKDQWADHGYVATKEDLMEFYKEWKQ